MHYLFLFFLAIISFCAEARDPLPAKSVFKPEISQEKLGEVYQTTIKIDFPSGYYLYADKTTIDKPFSQERSPTKQKDDPYLGKVNVWEKPPIITIKHPKPLESLILKTQGCEAEVICYPPITWQLTVPAVQMPSATSSIPFSALTPQKSFFKAPSTVPDLLDIDEAFQIDAKTDVAGNIVLSLHLPDGYYVYRNSVKIHYNNRLRDDVSLPTGEDHHDDFFGEQAIFRGDIDIVLPFYDEKSGEENQLQITLQGCAEGRVCYPPKTVAFSLEKVKPAPKLINSLNANGSQPNLVASADKTITDHLNEHFYLALPLLLLLGIGVSFTACIYPLVPIVTSLVIGKNTSTKQAYGLISAYVVAMGAAMALLGAIFGIFEINLQLVFQKPWIVVVAAFIFVALSLSLFDVYTLQAPRWLQNPVDKLSRKQQSGSYLGAAIMGALSVLVVSPCATPILTALLLFTTQTTPFKGAVALFVFGLGTGLPLFLFAGAFRQFMPKAGSWMDNVKKGFAFALLGIAAYLITRIMPLSYALGVWALFALFFAVYWFDVSGSKQRLFLSGLGLIVAIALAVQSLNAQFLTLSSVTSGENKTLSYPSERFQEVTTLEAIEKALAESDKPIILDFYADWCVSCKKWEREIWHDDQFSLPLADYTLLKVDITDFNEDHKIILQKLGLVGPPAVLIYPRYGHLDQPDEKIIGEMTAEEFAALLTEFSRK